MMRYRNRGVGDFLPQLESGDQCTPGTAANTAYCASLSTLASLNPFNIGCCFVNDLGTRAISQNPSLNESPSGVLAGAPTTSTCSAGDPGAVLSGSDANGNPIYICGSTAAQEQAAANAALQAAAAAQDAANAANVLAPGGSTDCTQWFNSFNPACLTGGQSLLWVAGGIAALLVLADVFGGRR